MDIFTVFYYYISVKEKILLYGNARGRAGFFNRISVMAFGPVCENGGII